MFAIVYARGFFLYTNQNCQFQILSTAFSEQTTKYNAHQYYCLYSITDVDTYTYDFYYVLTKIQSLHQSLLIWEDMNSTGISVYIATQLDMKFPG